MRSWQRFAPRGTSHVMGDRTGRRLASEVALASSRESIRASQTMVAWSIARLAATNPALRPRGPERAAQAFSAPGEILLQLLGSACDLDVLLFAQRHPRALLSIDHIARAVGHSAEDVDTSIDSLTARRLLACRKSMAGDAEAGVLFYEVTPGAWEAILPALAWVTASAHGRHALRRALSRQRGDGPVAAQLHPYRASEW